MANIKDVAKQAGVSITTVSHVINETRYVSVELTQRVRQAMDELNYRPNTLARSLRSGRSKTIGLVIPDISNLFFAEISRKIEDNGFAHNYSVILCNTDDDPKKEATYINVLLEKQVDGIIFISAGGTGENLEQTLKFNIPIVIADRNIKNINADIVLVNNKDGGYQATKYLVGLGHRKIGCISGPSLVTPSAQRLEGYKQALEETGISYDESLVKSGNFRFGGGERAMRELLTADGSPTAVFVCNDMMAMGAMRAIYDHELVIPDDVSLIGFDDIPLAQSVYPALTTIAQPIKEMADVIVNLLISRIAKESKRENEPNENNGYKRLVLDVVKIERESCKEID